MARRFRFRERNHVVNTLASFLVIMAGLAATTLISVISAPEPMVGIGIAVGLFLLIALVPAACMRAPRKDTWRPRERESFWSGIGDLFRRPKENPVRHKMWKLKPGTSVPPTHRSESSTFVPARGDDSLDG